MADPTPVAKSGYINGADLLLSVGGKAIGHCTTHTCTYNTETKERAVKPAASVAYGGTSLWKEKGVVGLSVSINFEGLRHFGETEEGLKSLLNAWKSGAAVTVTAYERDSSASPYLSGSFVIASLEQTAPAQDDSTFSGTLENNGEVTITPANLTGETIS